VIYLVGCAKVRIGRRQKLRGSVDASQYKHVVLGLDFSSPWTSRPKDAKKVFMDRRPALAHAIAKGEAAIEALENLMLADAWDALPAARQKVVAESVEAMRSDVARLRWLGVVPPESGDLALG
jgi:hypothetical protein